MMGGSGGTERVCPGVYFHVFGSLEVGVRVGFGFGS